MPLFSRSGTANTWIGHEQGGMDSLSRDGTVAGADY